MDECPTMRPIGRLIAGTEHDVNDDVGHVAAAGNQILGVRFGGN